MHRGRILYDLNGGLRAFSDNIDENCYLAGDNSMNDDDESEFARLLPGVKRLRNDRINVYPQRAPKKAPPRVNSQEIDRHTDFPAESLPARDTRFNSGLQKKLQRKIKQGAIRPESSIDLHGYRQTEAVEALELFIAEALQRRLRMVLVIHGQGYRSQSDAILKPLVQRWLATQSQVLAWCPAQARDGAAGASYVYLRCN
jgi:DNA-nicking Smr family endonuclease